MFSVKMHELQLLYAAKILQMTTLHFSSMWRVGRSKHPDLDERDEFSQ